MITVTEYKNQSVGVFGLGKAGQAAVQSLAAGGAKLFVWDDKGADGAYAVHYKDWPWQELKALVLAPGVPLTHPKPHEVVTYAKRYGVPVIGEVELMMRACPDARYVGITGTNGKSTTTALIAHILAHAGLKVQVGGNLGTPGLALEPLGKDGTYVLEMSSYQLDLVHSTRFNVAVLLNITPDHLDRHGWMEHYVDAKCHIFQRQQESDVAIVGVDDDYSREVADGWQWRKHKAKLVRISSQQKLEQGVFALNGEISDSTTRQTLPSIRSVPSLTGQHNWQNAAAAYGAARACGVAADIIHEAMKSFPGLRHRLQLVATIGGVRFINDSKATNADATANALAPYRNIYWIAGGKPKEGGIVSLAEYFPKIAHAFLIGEAEEEFAQTLEGKVSYTRCGTLAVAVEKAAAMAFSEHKPDAVVLLSPACASFDQWKSFEHRGDAFCEMVEKLKDSGSRIQDSGNPNTPNPESLTLKPGSYAS